MRLAGEILRLVSDATKGHDLTLRQFAFLEVAYLGGQDGTEVRLAAKALDLSKPACTRAADRLSEELLVRREPIPEDRRLNRVVPTAKGRRLIEAVMALRA
jgi:DNA-binding MarR family transcriptional regulator